MRAGWSKGEGEETKGRSREKARDEGGESEIYRVREVGRDGEREGGREIGGRGEGRDMCAVFNHFPAADIHDTLGTTIWS